MVIKEDDKYLNMLFPTTWGIEKLKALSKLYKAVEVTARPICHLDKHTDSSNLAILKRGIIAEKPDLKRSNVTS